jgi:hypothetical protein
MYAPHYFLLGLPPNFIKVLKCFAIKRKMRLPGFELGTEAWEAPMLTTTLQTRHDVKSESYFIAI